MRRDHQSKDRGPYLSTQKANGHGYGGMYTTHQLDNAKRINEAGAGKATYARSRELPAQQAAFELPAGQQRLL